MRGFFVNGIGSKWTVPVIMICILGTAFLSVLIGNAFAILFAYMTRASKLLVILAVAVFAILYGNLKFGKRPLFLATTALLTAALLMVFALPALAGSDALSGLADADDLLVYGFPAVALVIGVVGTATKSGMSTKWAPPLALALGLLAGLAISPDIKGIVTGIVIGAAACGTYDLGKKDIGGKGGV